MTFSSHLTSTNLFKPIKVGGVELSNRIVIAPLTRTRATKDGIPTDIMQQHYDERTKTPGSLVVTEGTLVNLDGIQHVPGIYTKQQALAWEKITSKVHDNKSFLSVQIVSLGRAADVQALNENNLKYLAPSAIYVNEEAEKNAEKFDNPLIAFTTEQVEQHVQYFVDAAVNAVEISKFDFIELHAAHGYLIDQFIQSISNQRTDRYGGNIENRARFLFEIVDAVINKVGISKVAIRFSPWATVNNMAGINADPHPYATWGYILSELEKRRKKFGKDFGYISFVEPRVNGDADVKSTESNDWVFDIYKGVVLRTGNYCDLNQSELDTSVLVKDVSANDRTLIGIGRPSTSNPDLIERLRNCQKLTKYQRKYFYVQTSKGYLGFPRFGEKAVEIENVLGKPLA